jgi:hypothetical protein
MPCSKALPARAAPRLFSVSLVRLSEKPLLVAEELLPGDVTGVGVVADDRPGRGGQLSRAALEARRFARQGLRPGLRASVHVGPGITGVVQYGQDAGVAQRPPAQLPIAGLAPQPVGEAEVLVGEVLHYRQSRPQLIEKSEDERNGVTDLFVGVKDEVTDPIEDQAGGRAKPQLTVFGLLELAAEQAAAQPVEFRLAHGTHDAEQQTVLILAGIVDAVFINHQRVSDSTDLQKAIPVTAGARQPGGLQTEDGPSAPEADFDEQRLEAVPVHGRSAGASLVLVDNRHRVGTPAEVEGALFQVVLPGGAGRVVQHLREAGLADVDEGAAVKVFGANLVELGTEQHDLSPLKGV